LKARAAPIRTVPHSFGTARHSYDGLMPTRQHAGPAPSSGVPETSLAERARTLAAVGKLGSLSTHSRKFPGFPFGSMMPYAIDELGRPLFFVSTMAMHTQNLADDPRASLLILQPDIAGDPLGAARLTLIGRALEAPKEEVEEVYLERHQEARYWKDFSDFSYFRLEVAGVYFIGGFGVMGWVTEAEYRDAAPDPLAQAARGIIDHMNADHADALKQIANRFGGESADEASMTAVDRLGFHVRLKSGDRVHGARVAFPREVRSSDEARQVFIEMVRAAR
jgi:heme iron utilization protein